MKKIFRGLSSILMLLLSILIGLTQSMFSAAGHINAALGIETSELVKKEGDAEIPTYFKSDYSKDINNYTSEELDKKNADVADFVEQEAEEGAVLLKNDNNALPLTASEIKKVSLFGRATVNPYHKSNSGGGTGGTKIDYLAALQERGFSWNTTLVDAYRGDKSALRTYDNIGESAISIYTDAVKASFASSEVAIVMLAREAGESHDLKREYNDNGETISMLALSKNEKDMLSLVKEYKDNGAFKKVIVLLNTSNPLEIDWLDEYGVDACMWIGGPGNSTGFRGVADLLTGESNPSGKLTDTYATNSLSAPATVNFGEFIYSNINTLAPQMKDPQGTSQYYVVQAEGIYVGYKYYETRYEDVVLGQGNANANVGVWASKGNTWNYADEVSYPFGYGMSYTTFTQTFLDTPKDNGDTLTVSVVVNNTGSKAGKSVVELYAQTPYGKYEKDNLVEKAAIQLVGFEKTGLIEPGESETVEITVDKYFLASYDYKNAKGYIMSEGDYYLAIGDDAHDALNNVLAAKNATNLVDFEGKAVSGDKNKVYHWEEKFDDSTYRFTAYGKVENLFDDADINYWAPDTAIYLSRQDWAGTYPVTATSVNGTAELATALDSYTYEKPEGAPSDVDVATEVQHNLKLADMVALEKNSSRWDDFIDQLSVEELIALVQDTQNLEAVPSIAFLGGKNTDGIDGIGVNAYVNQNLAASSWNKEMIGKRGYFMGEDCLFNRSQFVWGPGANTHRTPFGGRNFEYYSEDSFLAYELAAAQTKAMQEKGVITGIKHFFANDQETQRTGVATYGTEQAFREIQMRAFEGAFVKGGVTGVMTGFNRIGPTYMSHSSAAMNGVLRGEWGFYGIIITDAAGANTYVHSVETIANGTNMFCFSTRDVRSKALRNAIYQNEDGNLLLILKERVKETLYTYAHSNLMNGISSDYEVVYHTPWWQPAMIGIDIGVGALTFVSIVCYIFSAYVFKKKEVIAK